MLELTRGVDQAFVVGETIIRVVDIEDDEVRLAISSPHDHPRYREVTLRCGAPNNGIVLAVPGTHLAP